MYQHAEFSAGHREPPARDKALETRPRLVGYGCEHLQGLGDAVTWEVEADRGFEGHPADMTVTANCEDGDLYAFCVPVLFEPFVTGS